LLREQAQRPGTRNLQELEAWSELLASHAIQIDEQRKRYVELYQPFFADVAGKLSGMEEVRLDYYRGWNRGTDLRDIYQKESGLEQKRGFTQKGFQRADVRITVGGQSAAKVCSRGELKLLVWAMILAQGALASEVGRAGERGGTLYLVDDLASELDREHRKRVCDFLLDTGQQVLLTGVDQEPLLEACGNKYSRLFHVKHGQVIVQEY
jgi:DNA replication and repair protein RecF